MDKTQDAYGQYLLAQFHSQAPAAELIERDDNYIDTGSEPGLYFFEYAQWSPFEQQAIGRAKGRILDIGCGAGRHALYLQQQGFEVIAIDNAPGAIEVCKLRGVKNALVRSIAEVGEFAPNSFDTVLMLGNNFGLFGSAENAKLLLAELSRITSADAHIIAGTRNPYLTDSPDHLAYHELNRQRGRMAGQIKMRVRYKRAVGAWFDYLFVSPAEMREIVADTAWQIKEFIETCEANYIAILGKVPLSR